MGAIEKHIITEKTKAEVTALISFGNTQEEVAKYLGISVDTLARHYRQELDTAVVRANAQVAKALYNKATKQDDLSAQIFWLKTRGRWRTTDQEENKTAEISLLEKIISGELKVKND